MDDKTDIRQRFPVNSVRICIDDYENADLEGRIYSRMQKEPLYFKSFGELLLKVDRLFDERGFPQAFQRRRTFGEPEMFGGYHGRPEPNLSDEVIQGQLGRLGTFELEVWTRCRSGWQGVLCSVNGSARFSFRSEMELLRKLTFASEKERGRLEWEKVPGT